MIQLKRYESFKALLKPSFELKNLENKNINEICDKVMSMSDEDIKAQVEAKKLNLL